MNLWDMLQYGLRTCRMNRGVNEWLQSHPCTSAQVCWCRRPGAAAGAAPGPPLFPSRLLWPLASAPWEQHTGWRLTQPAFKETTIMFITGEGSWHTGCSLLPFCPRSPGCLCFSPPPLGTKINSRDGSMILNKSLPFDPLPLVFANEGG